MTMTATQAVRRATAAIARRNIFLNKCSTQDQYQMKQSITIKSASHCTRTFNNHQTYMPLRHMATRSHPEPLAVEKSKQIDEADKHWYNQQEFMSKYIVTSIPQEMRILQEGTNKMQQPPTKHIQAYVEKLQQEAGLKQLEESGVDSTSLEASMSTAQRLTPEQYIAAVPIIEVDGAIAVCDGGDGAMGHPLEYIQLNKVNLQEAETCKVCPKD
jgi:hypothetical protein